MIDVYLINGFLGAGKTTFLRSLLSDRFLKDSNKRIGVLVNEFSSAGIDGAVIESGTDSITVTEINGGSIFCACLKADFVKALADMLFYPLDMLFIEASGMADPSDMEKLLAETERLAVKKGDSGTVTRPERGFNYKGAVCVADAQRFAEEADVFVAAENQVRKSSLVVINKTDIASPESIAETRAAIAAYNPGAFIYETVYGFVPPEIFEASVSTASPAVGEETTNKCGNRLCAYIQRMPDVYAYAEGAGSIEDYIDAILPLTSRLKGFFVSKDGVIYHADCVGGTKTVTPWDTSGKSPETSLVIIGKSTERFGGKLFTAWEQILPYEYFECIYDS
jgi:G3E family GTPase